MEIGQLLPPICPIEGCHSVLGLANHSLGWYLEIEPWIDLGSVARQNPLIATTLKSAKGESVFTKLKPPGTCPGDFYLGPGRRRGICMTASLLPSESALFGREGELVSLSISTEPKLLEDLLEALASLDFPVNPQLYHRPSEVEVEFPAYSRQVDQVRETLRREGFDSGRLEISRPLTRSN
jgi:hypothetical protein